MKLLLKYYDPSGTIPLDFTDSFVNFAEFTVPVCKPISAKDVLADHLPTYGSCCRPSVAIVTDSALVTNLQ